MLSVSHNYYSNIFYFKIFVHRLRKSTWDRLQVLSGGVLTDLIDRLSKADLLYPLIVDKHKKGVERRLLVIYAVVEYCMGKNGDKMFKT